MTVAGGSDVRRVLLVACDWPPVGGSAVQRSVYFARALPRYGWHPCVLTETAPAGVPRDEELVRRAARVPCVRARPLRPPARFRATTGSGVAPGRRRGARLLLRARSLVTSIVMPDKRLGWWPSAVRAGRRQLARARFDAIYSTSPHPTAHLVAGRLARETGLPWVADFRDPWWIFLEARPLWPFSLLNTRLEGGVIRRASAVVGVRTGILDDFRRRFSDVSDDRFHLVPNGYDPAVFEGVEPLRDDRFGIVYVGTLYGARQPLPMLRTVKRALDRRPELARRLVLRFIGPSPSVLDAWREEAGLAPELVECLGFRPQREAAAWLRGADLLYLNSVEDYVPGKVYEYLGSGREVLALLDPGTEVGRLLAGREAAVVIAPDEVEAAAAVLLDRIRVWLDRGPAPDGPPATDLSREEGARMLAGILGVLTR